MAQELLAFLCRLSLSPRDVCNHQLCGGEATLHPRHPVVRYILAQVIFNWVKHWPGLSSNFFPAWHGCLFSPRRMSGWKDCRRAVGRAAASFTIYLTPSFFVCLRCRRPERLPMTTLDDRRKMKDWAFSELNLWLLIDSPSVAGRPSSHNYDNDGSFFTSIIRQEQHDDDDASIVNEASSITTHTIADDLGQPCHRWGICNFNLQRPRWSARRAKMDDSEMLFMHHHNDKLHRWLPNTTWPSQLNWLDC